MKIEEFRETLRRPLRQVTLCLLVRGDEVCLAMKKRGFGQGKWNGAGGKPEPGETLEDAARRETFEEIGVKPTKTHQVATIAYYFLDVLPEDDWNQQMFVYLVGEWERDGVRGAEPLESEEMLPKWFSKNSLPEEMWESDKHWLPRVLARERLDAEFLYNKEGRLLDYRITPL